MASRIARLAIGTLVVSFPFTFLTQFGELKLIDSGGIHPRPALPLRTLPTFCAPMIKSQHVSNMPNVPNEDPKKRAQSIIDSLPGSNLVSKTAILSAGAGFSVFGISNEFLVINEESVVAFCLLSVFWAIGRYGGPLYKEWAESQTTKIKGILNAAREEHTAAVQKRIDNVKQLGGVVDVTKNLFEVSKVRLIDRLYDLD